MFKFGYLQTQNEQKFSFRPLFQLVWKKLKQTAVLGEVELDNQNPLEVKSVLVCAMHFKNIVAALKEFMISL